MYHPESLTTQYHLTTQPPTQKPNQINAFKVIGAGIWERLIITLNPKSSSLVIHRYAIEGGLPSCFDEIVINLSMLQAEINHVQKREG